jgi:hypothetical protein
LNVCYKTYGEPIQGDLNNDNEVDSTDALLLKKAVIGNGTLSEEQKKKADMNGDGTVDSVDYLIEKKEILNK